MNNLIQLGVCVYPERFELPFPNTMIWVLPRVLDVTFYLKRWIHKRPTPVVEDNILSFFYQFKNIEFDHFYYTIWFDQRFKNIKKLIFTTFFAKNTRRML